MPSMIPALLQRMSMAPNVDVAASTIRAGASADERSASIDTTRSLPSPSDGVVGTTSTSTKRAPRRANSRAMAASDTRRGAGDDGDTSV